MLAPRLTSLVITYVLPGPAAVAVGIDERPLLACSWRCDPLTHGVFHGAHEMKQAETILIREVRWSRRTVAAFAGRHPYTRVQLGKRGKKHTREQKHTERGVR